MKANLTFSKEECSNPHQAVAQEWIDVNGIGGYSSSTIINCHTRKYHGLLVAELDQPKGRYVLLSKVEPSLVVNGKEHALGCNKFPGVFHPNGYQYLESFTYNLFPRAIYQVGDTKLKMSTLMLSGENTVLIKYKILEGSNVVTLRLRPQLAYRDKHSLQHYNEFLQMRTYVEKNGFHIEPYQGMPPLYMSLNRKCYFYPSPLWSFNLEYMEEQKRGYDYLEDLFCPGIFEIELKPGKEVVLAASTSVVSNANKKFISEVNRRKGKRKAAGEENNLIAELSYQSNQFIIKNHRNEMSILAGYHWFAEWGRDAMIALPGLTFHRSQPKVGLEILKTFGKYQKDGLIPNYICEDQNRCSYNSIDATFWYFWALQEYKKTGGTYKEIKTHFAETLRSILDIHINGTTPYTHLRFDGLLYTGNERTQLTWMDANSRGMPVTPRYGCPVEINALWYNALMFWIELCKKWKMTDPLTEQAKTITEKLKKNFVAKFWCKETDCLLDVYRDDFADASVRPNQIFAVSLPFTMLDKKKQKKVVEKVTKDLVTPYGLRTLSPTDKRFKPYYAGDQDTRDAAYHQGTVWPWLIGHYGDAYLKVAKSPKEGSAFLEEKFTPLLKDFNKDFGIAAIPEIYNGNPPHKANGCISQAWSMAEVLRLFKHIEKEKS